VLLLHGLHSPIQISSTETSLIEGEMPGAISNAYQAEIRHSVGTHHRHFNTNKDSEKRFPPFLANLTQGTLGRVNWGLAMWGPIISALCPAKDCLQALTLVRSSIEHHCQAEAMRRLHDKCCLPFC
jgi:hypothetical protein